MQGLGSWPRAYFGAASAQPPGSPTAWLASLLLDPAALLHCCTAPLNLKGTRSSTHRQLAPAPAPAPVCVSVLLVPAAAFFSACSCCAANKTRPKPRQRNASKSANLPTTRFSPERHLGIFFLVSFPTLSQTNSLSNSTLLPKSRKDDAKTSREKVDFARNGGWHSKGPARLGEEEQKINQGRQDTRTRAGIRQGIKREKEGVSRQSSETLRDDGRPTLAFFRRHKGVTASRQIPYRAPRR